MKLKLLLVAATLAVLPALAWADQTNISAITSAAAQKSPVVQPAPSTQASAQFTKAADRSTAWLPLSDLTRQQPTGKINRVDDLSSRPWTKVVGWNSQVPNLSKDDSHKPQLVLLSFNFK